MFCNLLNSCSSWRTTWRYMTGFDSRVKNLNTRIKSLQMNLTEGQRVGIEQCNFSAFAVQVLDVEREYRNLQSIRPISKGYSKVLQTTLTDIETNLSKLLIETHTKGQSFESTHSSSETTPEQPKKDFLSSCSQTKKMDYRSKEGRSSLSILAASLLRNSAADYCLVRPRFTQINSLAQKYFPTYKKSVEEEKIAALQALQTQFEETLLGVKNGTVEEKQAQDLISEISRLCESLSLRSPQTQAQAPTFFSFFPQSKVEAINTGNSPPLPSKDDLQAKLDEIKPSKRKEQLQKLIDQIETRPSIKDCDTLTTDFRNLHTVYFKDANADSSYQKDLTQLQTNFTEAIAAQKTKIRQDLRAAQQEELRQVQEVITSHEERYTKIINKIERSNPPPFQETLESLIDLTNKLVQLRSTIDSLEIPQDSKTKESKKITGLILEIEKQFTKAIDIQINKYSAGFAIKKCNENFQELSTLQEKISTLKKQECSSNQKKTLESGEETIKKLHLQNKEIHLLAHWLQKISSELDVYHSISLATAIWSRIDRLRQDPSPVDFNKKEKLIKNLLEKEILLPLREKNKGITFNLTKDDLYAEYQKLQSSATTSGKATELFSLQATKQPPFSIGIAALPFTDKMLETTTTTTKAAMKQAGDAVTAATSTVAAMVNGASNSLSQAWSGFGV